MDFLLVQRKFYLWSEEVSLSMMGVVVWGALASQFTRRFVFAGPEAYLGSGSWKRGLLLETEVLVVVKVEASTSIAFEERFCDSCGNKAVEDEAGRYGFSDAGGCMEGLGSSPLFSCPTSLSGGGWSGERVPSIETRAKSSQFRRSATIGVSCSFISTSSAS